MAIKPPTDEELAKPKHPADKPKSTGTGGTEKKKKEGSGSGPSDSGEVVVDSERSLPLGSKLVLVDGEYRLVWALGDGLGFAWYSISDATLRDVYGDNFEDSVDEEYTSVNGFSAVYGDFYWGNAEEISITADNPWEDLRDKIFQSFGPVAGFDSEEIKRLILQGYFEQWSLAEFDAHYRQTQYYQDTNQVQRDWAVMSEGDRATLVNQTAGDLLDRYRRFWGVDPEGGIDNVDILNSAKAIASGEESLDVWEYNTRVNAEAAEGTPAWRDAVDAAGDEQNLKENAIKYANDQWRLWMGTDPSADFGTTWGTNLWNETASEADLEQYLKTVSSSYWVNKDPNITFTDWAAPWKANIGRTLELGEVSNDDPLLKDILNQGVFGRDADLLMRQDSRFKETGQFQNQMTSAVSRLGRMFGFIT